MTGKITFQRISPLRGNHVKREMGTVMFIYPKAWLCRVATNVAFNARRRQRATLGLEADTAVDADADKDTERRLLMDRVRDLAADLPERQRTVFALRNFEGWTYAEIAAQLGCSVGAARSSEYKALKKIRAWMSTY